MERGEVKWFYYHFRGERVERQIVLDLLNGFAILLTLENPVVGEYHLYEGDFSSVHWFEDFSCLKMISSKHGKDGRRLSSCKIDI